MNPCTVCNETYCTDTYLEPTPSRKQQPEVNGVENVSPSWENKVADNHDTSGSSDKNRPDIPNNETNAKTEDKDHVDVMNEINNKIDEKKLIKPGTNGLEPMFKKKLDNGALPTTRYTKNKHVIFPSENMSLLTDTGNARYLKDGEPNTLGILQC